MSRGRIAFFLLSLALVLPLLSSGLRRAIAEGGTADSLYKQLSVFSEVLHLVRRAYVEEVSPDALLASALDGAADALDPMSSYVPAEAIERYTTALAIGASRSGLTVIKERGLTLVVAVAAGSPGAAAGIESRDTLLEIDGRPTRRMALWETRTLLAGETGTTLTLKTVRRGQPQDVTLTLGEFARRSAELELQEDVAVLRLFDCQPATVGEMAAAVEQLAAAGHQRLLIDVRGVAGGDPALAYRLAEPLAGGKLGALAGRDGEITTFESAGARWQGALVALIDRGSLGCSELLAVVLKESAGAQLVGQPSFGHAGRMTMLPLSSGARLWTADAFYTGPEGRRLSESQMPDTRVNEVSRRFGDGDQALEDQTLERGLELLREIELPAVARAA